MYCGVIQQCVGGKRSPLQLLSPGTSGMKSRYRVQSATVGASVMVADGTTPPAVSITATTFTLTIPCDIQITKTGARGTAEFRISMNGGRTWLENQVTAASYTAPVTGETVTFAVGTYNTDNRYTRTITDNTSTVGSTVCTMSGGAPRFQPNSANGQAGFLYNGASGTGDVLTSTGADAAILSGNNKPFTFAMVCSLASIQATPTTLQPFMSWSRSVTSANPFFAPGVRGPAATPANAHAANRENDTGVNQPLNSAATAPDTELHVYVFRSSGTDLTVTRDGVSVLSGTQNAGTLTIDQINLGGLKRFGATFLGSNIRIVDSVFYNADIGSVDASRLSRLYEMRYKIGSRFQVKRLICLADLGQSNSNGVVGTFMPAPPPGSPWTGMKMLRRIVNTPDAISDTTLQNLSFTTVTGGLFHGKAYQTAVNLFYAGYNVFLLNCSGNGTFLTDWIGAGTFSATLDTAFADAITLLNAYYPNATLEWYPFWDQGEAESKAVSATPATDWPTNWGSYPSPAAGTMLKKLIDATGQNVRPRIIQQCTQLNVAPSSAPHLAQMRTNAATVAANVNGFMIDWDAFCTLSQYMMADNTHRTGRCQNAVGTLWSDNLLANELAP